MNRLPQTPGPVSRTLQSGVAHGVYFGVPLVPVLSGSEALIWVGLVFGWLFAMTRVRAWLLWLREGT